jgi:hypothetical protein
MHGNNSNSTSKNTWKHCHRRRATQRLPSAVNGALVLTAAAQHIAQQRHAILLNLKFSENNYW